MEAAVLFRSSEHEAAAKIFLSLLEKHPTDLIVRARLAANAAHCLVKLGLFSRALPLFETAERAFAERGYDAYVARIGWGKARALRAVGDDDSALSALLAVFDRFDTLKADADCVRVGIELVEWLLPRDAFHEAREMCVRVYERAVRAPMPMQALEAVTYLREASIAESFSVDQAQYVRVFLETLSSSPNTEFLRPN